MKIKSIFRCLICNNPYFDYEKSHCSQCKDIIELSNNNDDDNNVSKKRKSLSLSTTKSPSSSVSNKKMFVDLVDEDDNNNNDGNNNNNNDDNNNNNNDDNNNNNNDDNNNNNNDDNNNDNNNNNNIDNNYNAAILSSCSSAINTEIECDTNNSNNVVEEFYENNDELDFYDDSEYWNDYDNTDNNMNTNMNTNMNDDKVEITTDDNKNENNAEDNDDDHCFICNHTLNDFSLDEKNSHIMDCLEQYEFSQSIKQQEDYENTDDSGLRSKNFFCVICDHNLSSKNLVLRCSHLKKCAKKFGISTKELLQMVSPSYDEFSVDEDDDKKDDNNIDKDDDDNDNNNDNHDSKDRNDNENNDINTKEQEPLKNAFTLLMTRAKEDGFIKPDKSTKSTSSSSSANAENGNAKNNTKYSRWNNWNNKKQSSDIVYAPKYKQIKFGQMQKPIIVDGFQYSNIALSDTYFLTHFHSDHYQGLDKHFNHGTIYCSPTTAGLVRLRLKVPSACIIPLELNKIHLVVAGGVNVKVVFLDANHCPGAVIILFFFESGQKVIHTGDFRWNNKLLNSSTILTDLAKNQTNPKNLIIYLDTTYCDPQYNFPAQEKCILSCLSQVQNEIENDEAEKGSKKTLFVFGAYGIGKERVFMSIAANLNVKIFVEPSRYKAMMCFNDWTTQEKSLLTTNPNITNFWVVPMNKINFNSLTKLKFRKGQMCKRVVAFQPTGWTFTQSTNPEPALHSKPPAESLNNAQVVSNDSLLVLRSNPRDNNIIYSVPYSEHSSFGELIDFIRIFKPHKIIPTVKTSVENVQMQLELLTKYSNLQNKLVGTVDSKKKSEFH